MLGRNLQRVSASSFRIPGSASSVLSANLFTTKPMGPILKGLNRKQKSSIQAFKVGHQFVLVAVRWFIVSLERKTNGFGPFKWNIG